MTGNTSEPNDPLMALLAQHGLAAHHDGLLKQQVDLEVLTTLSDEDASALATLLQMPFGPAKKLRSMCEALRAAQAASTDAVGGGSTTTTPTSAGTTSAATLPPLDPPLEQDLLDHLPTPIARAAKGMTTSNSPVHVWDAIVRTLSTILRFLCLVSKADYFASPSWHSSAINESFATLTTRPALGHWLQMVRQLLASASKATPPHATFLEELPRSWKHLTTPKHKWDKDVIDQDGRRQHSASDLGSLDWLVAVRNSIEHERSEKDVPLVTRARDIAVDMIRELHWLRRYELWVSDGVSTLLLQGHHGSNTGTPPCESSGGASMVIRRIPGLTGSAARELPLPPLIVASPSVGAGTAGLSASLAEAAMVLEAELPSHLRYSWVDAHGKRQTITTTLNLAELMECYARKQFPRVDLSCLDSTGLRARIADSTGRTLRLLETCGKYRSRLHVVRERYEPRLSRWIDAATPLLGIAAVAGSGKTGVLANLVERWEPDLASRLHEDQLGHTSAAAADAAPPRVLFVSARDLGPRTNTVDRILHERLQLDDRVTAEEVVRVVPNLTLVIDGLNEHPLRSDLLNSIVGSARLRAAGGPGIRTVLSWRSEDDSWVKPALQERSLWWNPERRTINPWTHLPKDSGRSMQAATRNLQIEAERTGRTATSADFVASARSSLMGHVDGSTLHFIKFESAASCVPLQSGMSANERMAFTFGCHSVKYPPDEGRVCLVPHRSSQVPTEDGPGGFRSPRGLYRTFVDEFRRVIGDSDPVYHWSAHERLMLRFIAARLDPGVDGERIEWIDELLGGVEQSGRLVDMLRVAEGRIMSPAQHGRYSINYVLPAACREDRVWNVLCDLMDWHQHRDRPSNARDPFSILPPIPRRADGERSGATGRAAAGTDPVAGGIRSGTDATRAFQQLQYGSASSWDRASAAALRQALYVYGQLRTASLVAIWVWLVTAARDDPRR